MTPAHAIGIGALLLLVTALVLGGLSGYRQARARGYSQTASLFDVGVFVSLTYLLFFVVEPVLILGFDTCSSDYVAALPYARKLELVGWASGFALIGYLGFAVGLRVRGAAAIGDALPYIRTSDAGPGRRRALVAGLFLLAVVGYSRFDFVRLLAEPHLRSEINVGMGYWFGLVQAGVVATLLAFAAHVRSPRGSYLRGAVLWSLPLGLAIFGSRTMVLSVWLTMAVVRAVLGRRASLGRDLALLLAMLVFLAGFLIYRRSAARRRWQGPRRPDATTFFARVPAALHFALYPYDAFLVYLDLYEDHFADRMGSGLYEVLAYAIPRKLLPERPVRAQFILRELLYPDARGGNPFTLVGYLHLNLSYVGVFLGMAFLGFLGGVMRQYLWIHRGEESVAVLYGFAVASSFPLMIGSFLPWLFGFLRLLVLYLAGLLALGPLVLRRGSRSSGRGLPQIPGEASGP